MREKVLYIFYGAVTTLVNYIVYLFCTVFLAIDYLLATVIAWSWAVIFAYVTNKFFVFGAKSTSIRTVFYEFKLFFSARVISGLIELICMYVFVSFLGVNDKVMKVLVGIIVVAINYIFSKWVIFKRTF